MKHKVDNIKVSPYVMKVAEGAANIKTLIQSATKGVSWLSDMQREALARQTRGSTAYRRESCGPG